MIIAVAIVVGVVVAYFAVPRLILYLMFKDGPK